MKKTICFYFQVHQPDRLRQYRFFDIGKESYYYDDFANKTILRRVADKCYLPANRLMLDLIEKVGPGGHFLEEPESAALSRREVWMPTVLDRNQHALWEQAGAKDTAQRVPLLGAVGPLQFEVVQYRMQTEYGAESRLEPGQWKVLRWVTTENGAPVDEGTLPTGARIAFDGAKKPVILFQDEWSCNFFAERNPKVKLSALPAEELPEELEAQIDSP